MPPLNLVAASLVAIASAPPSAEGLRHWGSFRQEGHRIGSAFEVEIVSDTLPELGGAKHVQFIRTEHLRAADGGHQLRAVRSVADSATCPAISQRLDLLARMKLPQIASPFQEQPDSKTIILDGTDSDISFPMRSGGGSRMTMSIASYAQPTVTAWIDDTMKALQPCWRAESS